MISFNSDGQNAAGDAWYKNDAPVLDGFEGNSLRPQPNLLAGKLRPVKQGLSAFVRNQEPGMKRVTEPVIVLKGQVMDYCLLTSTFGPLLK